MLDQTRPLTCFWHLVRLMDVRYSSIYYCVIHGPPEALAGGVRTATTPTKGTTQTQHKVLGRCMDEKASKLVTLLLLLRLKYLVGSFLFCGTCESCLDWSSWVASIYVAGRLSISAWFWTLYVQRAAAAYVHTTHSTDESSHAINAADTAVVLLVAADKLVAIQHPACVFMYSLSPRHTYYWYFVSILFSNSCSNSFQYLKMTADSM